MGDIRGRKTFYAAGFIVFTVGSALCGMSQSGEQLITFRVIQALRAALLIANASAIVTDTFSLTERGKAFGVLAMSVYLGLSIGPIAGGFLTSAFGWRSIFYINVPIGIVSAFIVNKNLRELSSVRADQKFDVLGSATLSVWLVLLLVALSLGGVEGWSSPTIVLLILGFAIVFTLFLLTEARIEQPLLDLNLFRIRLFSASTMSTLLNYVALLTVFFLMPFYLIIVKGYTPSLAGLLLISMPVVMTVISPLSGWLSDKIGSRVLATAGMGIVCLSLLLLSTLSLNSSFPEIVGRLMITGLGMGLFSAPNTNAVMSSAPKERSGVASATLATMRNLGQVLGITLAGILATSLIPQNLRYQVLSGAVLNTSAFPVEAFLQGIQLAFIAGAVISVFATFTSSLRGTRRPEK